MVESTRLALLLLLEGGLFLGGIGGASSSLLDCWCVSMEALELSLDDRSMSGALLMLEFDDEVDDAADVLPDDELWASCGGLKFDFPLAAEFFDDMLESFSQGDIAFCTGCFRVERGDVCGLMCALFSPRSVSTSACMEDSS